jgi:short-subunit dehydrogenase
MGSAEVAGMGYRAWEENRRVVVTGTRNALVAALVPFVPRKTLLTVVHRLQSPA